MGAAKKIVGPGSNDRDNRTRRSGFCECQDEIYPTNPVRALLLEIYLAEASAPRSRHRPPADLTNRMGNHRFLGGVLSRTN